MGNFKPWVRISPYSDEAVAVLGVGSGYAFLLIKLIERDRDLGKGALKNGMIAAINAERNMK
ncbi:hypothetical protein QUA62_28470 [Microcoleus sp. MON1_C1]